MNHRGYITFHNVSGHDFQTITFYYICASSFCSEVAKMLSNAIESKVDVVTHFARTKAEPTHFINLNSDHCDGDYHVHLFMDTDAVILNSRFREFPLTNAAAFIKRFT